MPASSLEVLRTAVIFGADAVYIGGEAFGLRAKAKNFSMEEMAEGIVFAHAHGVKVYVTANILAHNEDLEGARTYFEELRDMKPERCDALIISDPGMYAIAREVWEEAEIHISTQANNTNYGTYLFWRRLGAKRVVSARELSLREIREIRERIPGEMEIESFVHGAMCISYSGRCLLSSFLAGRDANRGSCTHPCRWKYAVVEETRPGEYMPVYENERGTYLFNSRDLCMIGHIPELVEAGIDSFKIEGRMKTALYVATVARTYRRAIDDYFESAGLYRQNMEWYEAEIAKCTHRRFTTGFYFKEPGTSAAGRGTSAESQGMPAAGQGISPVGQDASALCAGTPQAGLSTSAGQDASALGSGASQAGSGTFAGQDASALGSGTSAGQMQIYDNSTYINEYTYLGMVEEVNASWGEKPARCGMCFVRIEQRNKFAVGDVIELMKPDGRNVFVAVEAIYSLEGEPMESCPHAKQALWIGLSAEDVQGAGEDTAGGADAASGSNESREAVLAERYDILRVKAGRGLPG